MCAISLRHFISSNFSFMKKDIHPKYHNDCQVSCVCGNAFTTGSTEPAIKVELCGACHPFYTGKQKLVDASRRVEKFSAKVKAQEEISKSRKGKKVKAAKRAETRSSKEIVVKTKDIRKIAQVTLNKK
jgi:large subunit ribosomal protein L31